MVFLGTPYFSATSFFERPFSRSLKILYFSPKLFTLNFRLTEDICWTVLKERKNKLPNKVFSMQLLIFECLKWTVWFSRKPIQMFQIADRKHPKNDWRDRKNGLTQWKFEIAEFEIPKGFIREVNENAEGTK